MKRVLISGVAGLIGSHLADALIARGYRVTGVDDLSAGRMENIAAAQASGRFSFRRFDVSDRKALATALRRTRFDVVIHMAAAKKIGEAGSSLRVLTNNVDSTLALLERARADRAKFVFASTSDVYGVSRELPFSESGTITLGPSHIKRWSYAASKLYCEQLCFAYKYDHRLPVVVLRYFGCFGGRSNYGPSGGHVPMFLKTALEGGVITIHGDGKQTRSMAHVSDVVRGTVLAIERKSAVGELINIGSDEEISVRESAQIVLRVARSFSPLARRAKVAYIPMRKVFGDYQEIARRVPDLSKARRLLGYRPEIPFRRAVEIVAREMVA